MGKSTVNTNLSSETNTSTTQTDQSGNQGLNFSDVGGSVGLSFSTASDSHDVTQISTTDQGAVAAGQSLGLSGIAAASSATSSAISSVQKLNADSLSMFSALVDKSIDASKTATRDAAVNDSNFLNNALTGFQSLAKTSSASADDRITKLVGMGLVALVLVIALPVFFKSGSGKAAIA